MCGWRQAGEKVGYRRLEERVRGGQGRLQDLTEEGGVERSGDAAEGIAVVRCGGRLTQLIEQCLHPHGHSVRARWLLIEPRNLQPKVERQRIGRLEACCRCRMGHGARTMHEASVH